MFYQMQGVSTFKIPPASRSPFCSAFQLAEQLCASACACKPCRPHLQNRRGGTHDWKTDNRTDGISTICRALTDASDILRARMKNVSQSTRVVPAILFVDHTSHNITQHHTTSHNIHTNRITHHITPLITFIAPIQVSLYLEDSLKGKNA
jgi:hypothetical protein